jgi:hypothetical protein
MTQPTPTSTEQQRLRRGATFTLESLKQFGGTTRLATEGSVSISFPGTEHLADQLAQVGANEVHLRFYIKPIAYPPEISVLVFLNAPNATANTATTAGFVGSVSIFEHPGHNPGYYQLPLTAALKQTLVGATAVTATFVPAPFPGRTSVPQVLGITATLHLILSTVETPS